MYQLNNYKSSSIKTAWYCRVSFIEIYNETVKDLLNIEKDNIKVKDALRGVVKVDATEKVASSPEEVLDAMKEVKF